jgi:hypothetical protein
MAQTSREPRETKEPNPRERSDFRSAFPRRGRLTVVSGAGSGAVALAGAWARAASAAGEAAVILDARAELLPHAALAAADAPAPIWVVVPPTPGACWTAISVLVRSSAFGLVVALDPSRPPEDAVHRIRTLVRTHATRLVVTGATGLRPDLDLSLLPGSVAWMDSPIGAAPASRTLRVLCVARETSERVTLEIADDAIVGHRMRAPRRARDRRRAR